MEQDISTALNLLTRGEAPDHEGILKELSVGLDPLIDFLRDHYLNEYIAQGGSKIKFITGRSGSGKTHFTRYFESTAKGLGFNVIRFSARDVWLHDFGEIYAEIFKRLDFTGCLTRCGMKIVRDMGYEPEQIPAGMLFTDYLSDIGALDALTKKEILNQLRAMFLQNPLIDNNFAVACSLLAGGLLGHPQLENANRDLLLGWLSGSREIKMTALRPLGLSPSRITKFNARHMLRSLTQVGLIAGYPGIVVSVDDLDVLVRTRPLDALRYTRLKREDVYESIRELIDEIDSQKNILFLFSFDKALIDDEVGGLKSYQALWMRIQNEIVSERFNKFTDILDMDAYGAQYFTEDTALEMSRRLANLYNRFDHSAAAVGRQQVSEIMSKVRFGKTSLPRQINKATLQTEVM